SSSCILRSSLCWLLFHSPTSSRPCFRSLRLDNEVHFEIDCFAHECPGSWSLNPRLPLFPAFFLFHRPLRFFGGTKAAGLGCCSREASRTCPGSIAPSASPSGPNIAAFDNPTQPSPLPLSPFRTMWQCCVHSTVDQADAGLWA